MKIVIFCLSLFLISCGKDSGSSSNTSSQASKYGLGGPCSSSSVLGEWKSLNTGEIIEFTSNCKYNNVYCKSQGSFPSTDVTYNSGTVRITVDMKGTNTPRACLPVGEYTCSYNIGYQYSPIVLSINCAGVNGIYEKQ